MSLSVSQVLSTLAELRLPTEPPDGYLQARQIATALGVSRRAAQTKVAAAIEDGVDFVQLRGAGSSRAVHAEQFLIWYQEHR